MVDRIWEANKEIIFARFGKFRQQEGLWVLEAPDFKDTPQYHLHNSGHFFQSHRCM